MNKRVLIITTRSFSSLHGGDALRLWHVVNAFTVKGCSVTLLSLDRGKFGFDFDRIAVCRHLKVSIFSRIYYALYLVLLRRVPITVAIYQSLDLRDYVERAVQDYDLIVFHLVRSVPPLLSDNVKFVVEATDKISDNYFRIRRRFQFSDIFNFKLLVFFFDAVRLENYEIDVLRRALKFVLVGDRDASSLLRVADIELHNRILVIPNGRSKVCLEFSTQTVQYVGGALFIGNLKSEQNWSGLLEFLTSCYVKLSRDKCPITIAGNIPSHREVALMERFPEINLIKNYLSISDLSGRFSIGVCPVRVGAGIQNKILDYVELGIPIITTSIASDAFNFGDYLYVEDDFNEWYQIIMECHEARGQVSKKIVPKSFLKSYDWETNMEIFFNSVSS